MSDQLTLSARLRAIADNAPGFLPDAEADALRMGAAAAGSGLWMEIGSYCGKSTVHLGAVARAASAHLVAVDHHHGSEENQPGWDYHDPQTIDSRTGRVDTLPFLRHALHDTDLEHVVTVIVGSTQQVAAWWSSPLDFLFLDGNHTEPVADHDYLMFAKHLRAGGTLAVHDVFSDPKDGGRAPWRVVQRAVTSGAFTPMSECGSLRVLRRAAAPIT